MSNIVTANDGNRLDLGNLPQTFGYTGLNLTSITVTADRYNAAGTAAETKTYVQTLTYSGSNLTSESGWIVQ